MDILGGITTLGRKATMFAARFRMSRHGNVAMIFALVMPVLVLLTVGGVDIHRAASVRANLQDALDAAALAAARSNLEEDEDLNRVGLAALKANLKAYPQIVLREDLTTFTLVDSVVIANATVDVDALVANIVLPPYGQFLDDTLPVWAHSEVNRSSKNIEVALVLDVTGSMRGQRIIDLRNAAIDLVDIVVQDVQSPYYSRMAVIPYSMGVNMGDLAARARGAPIGSTKAISSIEWHAGNVRTVTGATRAYRPTISASNHGFEEGDTVAFWDASGMTQLNGVAFTVYSTRKNSFRIEANSSNWNSLSRNASVAQCLRSDCHPIVTANRHGLDSTAYITGVDGMTQLNDRGFEIADVTTNTFRLKTVGARVYDSDGDVTCGEYGCAARVFTNPSSQVRGLFGSTCVSERSGDEADTDAAPSTAWVGWNYPTLSGNDCPSVAMRPLSHDKARIVEMIEDLEDGGSTAGQIGIAWGWYALSPNFNDLWPTDAAPYDPNETIKSVIIMTDGEFNTPYCSGVIAENAGEGSGGTQDKINCDGVDPFEQGEALCDGMKAEGIMIYTVGFQIADGGAAEALLRACATRPDLVFLPTTGSDLSEDFAEIGRDITQLRISK